MNEDRAVLALPVEQQNFTALRERCAEWLEAVHLGEVDSDLEHSIFEAAIGAIYGPNVWTWVNAQDYEEF